MHNWSRQASRLFRHPAQAHARGTELCRPEPYGTKILRHWDAGQMRTDLPVTGVGRVGAGSELLRTDADTSHIISVYAFLLHADNRKPARICPHHHYTTGKRRTDPGG